VAPLFAILLLENFWRREDTLSIDATIRLFQHSSPSEWLDMMKPPDLEFQCSDSGESGSTTKCYRFPEYLLVLTGLGSVIWDESVDSADPSGLSPLRRRPRCVGLARQYTVEKM
jgi:hypothetical protein